MRMTSFDQLRPRPARTLRRDRAALSRRRRRSACAARSRSSIRLARRGALRLWELLKRDEPVRALGAVTGNQAMQMVRAGLEAIYLSGWQAAADANTAGAMYPDQSLYPANAGPGAGAPDQPHARSAPTRSSMLEGGAQRDWFAPIVADAEAGFGGPLNCFEIMKAYIEAGAAGVHFEDQLASREEVRPSGRQGADPDPGRDPQPRRRAARRRRLRRADHARRPHRRRKRQADHQRRRRARPPVPHRRADAAKASSA